LKLEYKTPSQESLDYITLKYPDMSALTMPDSWHQDSTTLLERCKTLTGFIEFVDMLWLGAQSVKQPVYDLGFVDESQDISTCAFHLITRLCKNVVFCGDRNQAIYAFAGASEEMYNTIEKQSDAVLPLLTTQRCPKFICDLANGVRPGGIIHGPNQEQGEHQTLTYDSLPEKIRDYPGPKTLVLSRTNAALVGCALRLHKKGVPCRIINKELSDHVLGFLYQFSTRDIHKLRRNVEAWRDRQGSSRNALWAAMANDQADAAMHLLNRVQTWNDLTALIKETFETHHDGVRLSTIHGAKGLEASNIFILNPPIELPAAMAHPISKEQEINLHFVALTRSNKNLYWVHP